MNCPKCHSEMNLYGLPNHIYPGWWKCYGCDPYGRCYSTDEVGGLDEMEASRRQSRANAESAPGSRKRKGGRRG